MKKILITLLICIPFLAGCTSIDTTLTINKDQSASLRTELQYSGILNDDEPIGSLIVNNYDRFLDDSYETKLDYKNGISTIVGTKRVPDLQRQDIDLKSLGFQSKLPSEKFVEIKKNFLITSYNIDAVYNVHKVNSSMRWGELRGKKRTSSGLVPEYFQKYGDLNDIVPEGQARQDFLNNMDAGTMALDMDNTTSYSVNSGRKSDIPMKAVFNIKLPGKASFNNADATNGNIYTWRIKPNEITVVKLQYVCYNGLSIFILFILGVALLCYLAYRITKHESLKRVDKSPVINTSNVYVIKKEDVE